MRRKTMLMRCLLLGSIVICSLFSSCSEKTYVTTLVYENTTNLWVKIAACTGGIQSRVEWEVYLLPKESASKVITKYNSEDVFETIGYFELSFSDGRSVKYERSDGAYINSDTNLFNFSLYDGNRDTGIHKLKISEKHYDESTKE